MKKIKINEKAKTSNETFLIDEKRGREIFDHIYSRIISDKNGTEDVFCAATEIKILQEKFSEPNEFLYSIYVLGFLTRTFIERQWRNRQPAIDLSGESISGQYFDLKCKVH